MNARPGHWGGKGRRRRDWAATAARVGKEATVGLRVAPSVGAEVALTLGLQLTIESKSSSQGIGFQFILRISSMLASTEFDRIKDQRAD